MRNEKGQFVKGSKDHNMSGLGHGFNGRHTSESKLKMSLAKKGRVSTFKGKHHSDETRAKMSQIKKGKKQTEQWKKQHFERMKNFKHTEESKIKMSLISRGKKKNYDIWNKNTKGLTKPNSMSFKKGIIPWNKGKPSKLSRENHYNWKGGLTKLSSQIRTCLRYKQWHKEVLSIDWFKCIECNSKKDLEVDHIKPFSIIMQENKIKTLKEALACEELWNTDNGRTLCFECHKKTDTYGRKANNYKFNIK